MPLPLQIVFHNVQHSDAVEAAIREKANKLDQFFGRIMGCRVTVGLIQKHKHQGKLFNIRIDLTVPGSEIIVNRDKAEDIYVAIRDAFDHAKRMLEDYARRLRGDIKTHEPESRGRIVRLLPDEGYGFIEKSDGTEFYFHRFSVAHPDFDRLLIGDEVVFLEEPAGEGMQANRVSVRKH
jgi:ribosomal subunit interface protein